MHSPSIALVPLLLAAAIRQGDGKVDYPGLGKAYLADADAKRPAGEEPKTFLDRIGALEHRIPFGAFTLGIPKSAKPAEVQADAALAMKVVRAWVERSDADGKPDDDAKKALAKLDAWIKGWKPASIGATTPEVDAALALVAKVIPHADPPPAVLLAPRRADFFALVGAAGIFDPTQSARLWTDGMKTWASATVLPGVTVIALTWGNANAPLVGLDMSPMEQAAAVAHNASHAVTNTVLARAPFWLRESFAIVDTIDAVKEDETRCTGFTSGAQTEERSGFQPGQLQDFALVPAISAEKSPYRRGPSGHFFLKELKAARHPDGFALADFDTGDTKKTLLVKTPLLRDADAMPAEVKAAAPGYQGSFAEFFRAYGAAFVHYLGDQKHDKKPIVPAVLAEMAASKSTFHQAAEKVTGRTIGASADPKKDWEGAFLAWLATRS
ncbi:MAG TPA: hypothetical protein VKE69_00905 [Planctomycetota bacterium]|nr:hypothetical protein [Planctomycetota bacterium]